jgi:hypothetical protein
MLTKVPSPRSAALLPLGPCLSAEAWHFRKPTLGTNHKSHADDPPGLNTSLHSFPFFTSYSQAIPTHESPSSAVMIPHTCALSRVGLRRIPTVPTRSRISGITTNLEYAPSRTSLSRISRRCNASKPPVAQKAPESANTIPGPSWLWLEPIYEPFRAYGRVQQRKPYMTQFISSLVIYFVGDLVAQSIAEPMPREATLDEGEEKGWVQEWSDNRDWHRTGRSLLIGGLSSIPAYKWFLWLGNNFNYGSKILSLTTKVRRSSQIRSWSALLTPTTGCCKSGSLHAHFQLVFLRHAIPPLRRILPRSHRAHKEHGAHELDQ